MCNGNVIVSGIFSLIGIIIGFLLNYCYEYFKSKKFNDNVRSLFRYEIQQNKNILIKLKNQINNMNGEEVSFNRPFDMIMLVWNKWNAELPSVFNEDEISYLLEVYSMLEELMDDDNWILYISEDDSKFSERDFFNVQDKLDLVENKKNNILNKINELLSLLEINLI
jgi:hypothetical protein